MLTYHIGFVDRPLFGSVEQVFSEVQNQVNDAAQNGWILDHVMPVQTNGTTTGALIVMKKSTETLT